MTRVSFARRLSELADAAPDRPAVSCGETQLTRRQLDSDANALARGANVYPAEVEGALQEHPAVRSCAVIGLPDEDKGSRVHAVVEADPAEVSKEDLLAFVAERLARYKVPRSVEFVDHGLRDDAGKVRRSELRRQRVG